jgi:polyisoprenoid-binding protein YceI
VSTEIKRDGAAYVVTGNLELHGVTKSVTFPATIDVTPSAVAVKAEFGVNRKDFGIVYPGAADDLIKDNVLLQISLTAPRTKPGA